MSIAPNRKDFYQEKLKQGYCHKQAIQLSWVDYFEFGKDGYGTSGYSSNYKFEVACTDCNVGHSFRSADSVRLFIHDHKNHKTGSFAHK